MAAHVELLFKQFHIAGNDRGSDRVSLAGCLGLGSWRFTGNFKVYSSLNGVNTLILQAAIMTASIRISSSALTQRLFQDPVGLLLMELISVCDQLTI